MEEAVVRAFSAIAPITGYIYPNEYELHWGLLIVLYPYLTGLVAGAFILASLERVFNLKALQPVYRLQQHNKGTYGQDVLHQQSQGCSDVHSSKQFSGWTR